MLEAVHDRLAPVHIERLPYAELIRRYDRPEALFYLDPPYWGCEDDYGAGVFSREDVSPRLTARLGGSKESRMPSMATATTAGIWIAALALLGILARQIVPWSKQHSDSEARLRDTLIARVERLELKLERQQVRHDAEKRLLTHKLRNMTANFDAMLMMLEMNPDRGPEIVAVIKAQRTAQMLAEAKEAAIISAAELQVADDELGEPEADQ